MTDVFFKQPTTEGGVVLFENRRNFHVFIYLKWVRPAAWQVDPDSEFSMSALFKHRETQLMPKTATTMSPTTLWSHCGSMDPKKWWFQWGATEFVSTLRAQEGLHGFQTSKKLTDTWYNVYLYMQIDFFDFNMYRLYGQCYSMSISLWTK